MKFSAALFHTTSAAMRAEKVLKKTDLIFKLIPTPRQLSSDCGIALRFETAHCEAITTLFAASAIETAGIHNLD